MKKYALLAALCLSLLGLVVPKPAVADEVTTVTWPAMTAFNPAITNYTFHVENPLGGDLRVKWRWHSIDIPDAGDVTMTFPQDGEGVLTVLRCTGSLSCTEVGAVSPQLTVASEVNVWQPKGSDLVGPGQATHPLKAWPRSHALELNWELRTEDRPTAPTVAAGTTSAPAGDAGFGIPLAGIPLEHGRRYFMEVEATSSTADFGQLTGHLSSSFVYDERATGTFRLRDETVYPANDGFRDTLGFRMVTEDNELIDHVVVDLLDGSGRVVRTMLREEAATQTRGVSMNWDVARNLGPRVAPGSYFVRVRGRDLAGNRLDARQAFEMSDKRLRTERWQRRVTAQRSLSWTDVGTCSTLARRAGGALGFYSQTTCRRPNQSMVATQHGMYLPRSMEHSYNDLRVTLHGGKAAGRSDAYIVMYYVTKDGVLRYRKQFDGRSGAHQGAVGDRPTIFHDRTGDRPFVIWFVGLGEGSRYDVSGYTVSVDRRVLR